MYYYLRTIDNILVYICQSRLLVTIAASSYSFIGAPRARCLLLRAPSPIRRVSRSEGGAAERTPKQPATTTAAKE